MDWQYCIQRRGSHRTSKTPPFRRPENKNLWQTTCASCRENFLNGLPIFTIVRRRQPWYSSITVKEVGFIGWYLVYTHGTSVYPFPIWIAVGKLVRSISAITGPWIFYGVNISKSHKRGIVNQPSLQLIDNTISTNTLCLRYTIPYNSWQIVQYK